MSEDGQPENPYKRGTIQYWIWEHYIGPIINPQSAGSISAIQKVVSAKDLSKLISDGSHVFVHELKSGDVVVAQVATREDIMAVAKKALG